LADLDGERRRMGEEESKVEGEDGEEARRVV
jgi:hypothetical protein